MKTEDKRGSLRTLEAVISSKNNLRKVTCLNSNSLKSAVY